MKINGTGGIDTIKVYSAQLKKAEANKKASDQAWGDTFEISPEAKKIQSYLTRLEKSPEVRDDLVASLKKQIEEGTYRPDSKRIASGILQERLVDKAGHKGL
ncbi:MAG: Anti-sigma-28 factor, FlgM [Pelotomaculum sp. PtaU1.Bin035]|nr:MAG: Anti-sigma-28 factor, FlgM [Pelotomaculum sp. PtaU1.Bin035]